MLSERTGDVEENTSVYKTDWHPGRHNIHRKNSYPRSSLYPTKSATHLKNCVNFSVSPNLPERCSNNNNKNNNNNNDNDNNNNNNNNNNNDNNNKYKSKLDLE